MCNALTTFVPTKPDHCLKVIRPDQPHFRIHHSIIIPSLLRLILDLVALFGPPLRGPLPHVSEPLLGNAKCHSPLFAARDFRGVNSAGGTSPSLYHFYFSYNLLEPPTFFFLSWISFPFFFFCFFFSLLCLIVLVAFSWGSRNIHNFPPFSFGVHPIRTGEGNRVR